MMTTCMHHHLGMLCNFVQNERYLYNIPFTKAFRGISVEVVLYWASSEVSALKLHTLISWNSRSANTRELIDPSMGHLASLAGNDMARATNLRTDDFLESDLLLMMANAQNAPSSRHVLPLLCPERALFVRTVRQGI